jgi:hypothetical protein
VAELLLKRGADVKVSDSHGCTPLMLAVNSGTISLIRLYTNHGADVNGTDAVNVAPLAVAASRGHVDAVRCFCVAPAPMRLLISGGDGGRVCLWYLPALETKPIADVVAMRESRDASPDVAAALDAASSSVVRVLKGHEGPVVALECDFSKVVSAGCVSRVIVVPSVVSQRLQADTPPCFPSPPCSLRAWSDSM